MKISAVVLVGMLGLGASCSGAPAHQRAQRTTAPSSSASSTTTARAAIAVPAVLDWQAPAVAVNAARVVGAELVGRPVALWFWAPW